MAVLGASTAYSGALSVLPLVPMSSELLPLPLWTYLWATTLLAYAAYSHDNVEAERVDGMVDREFFRMLDELSGAAVIAHDESDRIVHWNRRAARLYGFELQDVVGKRYDELLKPVVDPTFERLAADREGWAESAGQRAWAGDVTRVDGSFVPIQSFDAGTIHWDHGIERYRLDFDRSSIAAVRRAIDLEDVRLNIARTLDAQAKLAAIVGHDVNTQIQSVIGYTDLAALELPEDHPCPSAPPRHHANVSNSPGGLSATARFFRSQPSGSQSQQSLVAGPHTGSVAAAIHPIDHHTPGYPGGRAPIGADRPQSGAGYAYANGCRNRRRDPRRRRWNSPFRRRWKP